MLSISSILIHCIRQVVGKIAAECERESHNISFTVEHRSNEVIHQWANDVALCMLLAVFPKLRQSLRYRVLAYITPPPLPPNDRSTWNALYSIRNRLHLVICRWGTIRCASLIAHSVTHSWERAATVVVPFCPLSVVTHREDAALYLSVALNNIPWTVANGHFDCHSNGWMNGSGRMMNSSYFTLGRRRWCWSFSF